MINSLCGSSLSLKSENSCTKLQPTSSNESKKNATQSCDHLEQTSLTPPSLNLPAFKFDLDGDVEVQSPDSSIWESFFSDQLDSDFMISSPVRNMPSPQASTYNCNYNYAQAMQGQSLTGCSPPRFSSQIGAFSSSSHRGKGLSPLHRVFNSPNQYMQPVENLSLPAIEEFLEGYQGDHSLAGGYSSIKLSDIGSSSECFDMSTSIPSLLDSLTMASSSRYCGSVSEESLVHGNSQLSQEGDMYQMGSFATASLSQALQQERQQEKQQQEQHSNQQPHSLMVPLPIGTDQVKAFLWLPNPLQFSLLTRGFFAFPLIYIIVLSFYLSYVFIQKL